MDRRRFLLTSLAGALAVPLTAEAQRAGRVPRVGVLSPGNPPPRDAFHQRARFEEGLRELGWTPASNILVDYRYAEGKLERLPALAAELVRVPVNVIIARGLTIAAARQATTKIPIVDGRRSRPSAQRVRSPAWHAPAATSPGSARKPWIRSTSSSSS